MTVVVTGAAGHLGGNLVRILLERGQAVRTLVRRDRRAIAGLDVEVVEGDICDPASLRRAFAGAQVVYHAAAYISILRSEWPHLEAVNVVGTRHVVAACLECGVRRLVHFSSIHAIMQEPLDSPVDESRPLVDGRSCSPYGRSKAAGEGEVRRGIERGLDAVILNPTAISGPYDFRPSHFGEVLLYLGRGALPALVNGGFDWVDARDVAAGAICAAERSPGGASYLLSGHWVSLPQIATMVERITGVHAPWFVCPLGLARVSAPLATAAACLIRRRPLFTSVSVEALCGNRRVSHERATRELGYQPRPFRETLTDTLRWFAEDGRLECPPALRPTEEIWTKAPSSTA
jgi:dihydroflavonol-4-reductase